MSTSRTEMERQAPRHENALTRKIGPLPAWGWAALGVGGFLVYKFFIAKKKTSTTLPTGSTAVSATAVTPGAAGSYGGGGGTGATPTQLGNVLGSIQTLTGRYATLTAKYRTLTTKYQTAQKQAAAEAAAVTKATAAEKQTQAQVSGLKGPNLGVTNLGGQLYDVLGTFKTTGAYTGYNVGGGAPVYFTWTGNGTPTQGAPPKGSKGVVVYTPTSTPKTLVSPTHVTVNPSWSQGYT